VGGIRIGLVAAVALNGAIGLRGRLPWNFPSDLKRFRAITMGQAVVMGRKTWDSLGGPLPGRDCIVVASRSTTAPHMVRDPMEAAALARMLGNDRLYAIGGRSIFAWGLEHADELHLTEVDLSPEGDTWFPAWDRADWTETARERLPSEGEAPSGTYLRFERKR
jgi:dihydrofolate reductase